MNIVLLESLGVPEELLNACAKPSPTPDTPSPPIPGTPTPRSRSSVPRTLRSS